MNKVIKVVLLLAIAIVLVLGAIWLQNKYQKPTPTPTPTPELTNLIDVKIVYSENNGSLPPPYHSETIVTVYSDQQGVITGSVIVKGYDDNDIRSKKNFLVSKKQFEDLYKATKNVESLEQEETGCTGGSGAYLMLREADVIDKEIYSYTCGGINSNPSLSTFGKELKRILQIII